MQCSAKVEEQKCDERKEYNCKCQSDSISIIVLSLQKYGVYGKFLYMDYVCFYRFYRKNLFSVLFLIFLRIMGGMTDSSSPPNPFQRAANNSFFFGSSSQAVEGDRLRLGNETCCL